jgi:hypothetical protein
MPVTGCDDDIEGCQMLRIPHWMEGWRDGMTGGWRKLHNEELNDLYSSPNIIRNIKSRRRRWAGHVARMGGEEERV